MAWTPAGPFEVWLPHVSGPLKHQAAVGIRRADDRRQVITCSLAEWTAFLAEAKAGRLDVQGPAADSQPVANGETRLPGELVTPGEASAMLRVGVKALSVWADAGKLTVLRLPNGHRRYYRAEVEAIRDGLNRKDHPRA